MKRTLFLLVATFSLNAAALVVEGVDGDTLAQQLIVATNDQIDKKPTPFKRNYDAPVTAKEKKDIAYIVNTLAEKSLFSLLGYKSSLEEAGDRVGHVHPLRFLMCIFTDPQLKEGIKAIKKRGGWVWSDFMGGLGDSLSEESKRHNLTDKQLADFSKRIGVDSSLLTPPFHKKKWPDFVGVLIKKV